MKADPVTFLLWTSMGGQVLSSSGRPYLLLYAAPPDQAKLSLARILCFGPDGVFGTADDTELFLQ